ncbi:hypothetical protein D8L93_03235 [Sodalis-like symbiont of Bactericera trigonica]|nr:hypothetical protein D8L93_03235 [Sodalis-like symbiont of Bactericera trigonica]
MDAVGVTLRSVSAGAGAAAAGHATAGEGQEGFSLAEVLAALAACSLLLTVRWRCIFFPRCTATSKALCCSLERAVSLTCSGQLKLATLPDCL